MWLLCTRMTRTASQRRPMAASCTGSTRFWRTARALPTRSPTGPRLLLFPMRPHPKFAALLTFLAVVVLPVPLIRSWTACLLSFSTASLLRSRIVLTHMLISAPMSTLTLSSNRCPTPPPFPPSTLSAALRRLVIFASPPRGHAEAVHLSWKSKVPSLIWVDRLWPRGRSRWWAAEALTRSIFWTSICAGFIDVLCSKPNEGSMHNTTGQCCPWLHPKHVSSLCGVGCPNRKCFFTTHHDFVSVASRANNLIAAIVRCETARRSKAKSLSSVYDFYSVG